MNEIIILIISQIVFSFSRNLNVRYTSRDSVLMALISSVVTKVVWLVVIYIGVNAIMMENYFTVAVFIVSGVFGDWLSFKVKL